MLFSIRVKERQLIFQPEFLLQIADMSVWHEVISEGKTTANDHHHEQVPAGLLAGNVYSFGLLLLEIISGKLPIPYPGHERSLMSSVMTTTLSMEHHF